MKIRIKKQNKDIGLKTLNNFTYSKSLSQEAKDLIDEIEDVDKDIDIYKLVFIGINKKKYIFLGCHWVSSQLFIIEKLH